MGIKERQERDREAVRRSILDAARELFVSEGFEQVSMRKIAERVEYSPAAIYGYFPSKDDIFFALAEDGFRLMYGDQQSLDALDELPPLERVRRLFWRFYAFSCEHPQYFSLMFVDRSVPRIGREYERLRFAREGKQLLLGHIAAAVETGDLPPTTSPEAVLHVVSCGLVGVAAMRLSDRMPAEMADALARDVLAVTLAGLRVAPPAHFISAACPLDTPDFSLHDAHVSLQEPRS
ncbi:MAG: TetR/AcrR family transcriptional regulator [Vicinamibacterales bacterium]